MLKATQAYLQTQVNTTTQGDLLIMLYDGAIKFLGQAKQKIAEKDYAQKGILITKAINVISELDESLNGQKGGDLAQNLHKLYFYCNTRLLKANLEMNIDLVDEVLRILTALRGAFDQIKGSAEQGQDGVTLSSGPEPMPPPAADPGLILEDKNRESEVQEPEAPPRTDEVQESQALETKVQENEVQENEGTETEAQEPEAPPQTGETQESQAPESEAQESEAENTAKPRPAAIGAYRKIQAYHQTP